MTVAVCGSMAFDTIMVFHDRFKNHILPDQVHILNVSFLTPEMRREFGGCAGNIAYSLHLLGGDARIVAAVGEDADPYLRRLDALGLSRQTVRVIPDTYTAQAFITTDLDDNQITAFHPGAMGFSDQISVSEIEGVTLGIVAPDGKAGMLRHMALFEQEGVPFVFDPGQALPLYSGEDILSCMQKATYCVVNDYEARLMCDKAGVSLEALASMVEAMIVTKGAQGSRIYSAGTHEDVPATPVSQVIDPTGCGDAYRGGLLFGLEKGYSLRKCAQLGAVMGAIKAECRGGQNHTPTLDDIADRYRSAYGELPW